MIEQLARSGDGLGGAELRRAPLHPWPRQVLERRRHHAGEPGRSERLGDRLGVVVVVPHQPHARQQALVGAHARERRDVLGLEVALDAEVELAHHVAAQRLGRRGAAQEAEREMGVGVDEGGSEQPVAEVAQREAGFVRPALQIVAIAIAARSAHLGDA